MHEVFLIWSGERAKQCAMALKDHVLDPCLDARVFVASSSVPLGQAWPEEVLRALCTAQFGLACITSDTLYVDFEGKPKFRSDWPHFELGSMTGRGVDVAPVLFDGVKPDQLGHAFGSRQCLELAPILSGPTTNLKPHEAHPDVYGLVQDLNRKMGMRKGRETIKSRFDGSTGRFFDFMRGLGNPPRAPETIRRDAVVFMNPFVNQAHVPALLLDAFLQVLDRPTEQALAHLKETAVELLRHTKKS